MKRDPNIQGTMVHLNSNILCAIDVKTTGLDSTEHEIYEIGIIPIDSFLQRRRDKMPLDLRLKPNYPEKIDWKYLEKRNVKGNLEKAMIEGHPHHIGMDIFDRWIESLNFSFRKKIAPVGYGYGLESRFLRQWMGDNSYREVIDDTELREVQTVARFLNDMADIRQTEYPFKKIRLNYLASTLNVWTDYGKAQGAIHEAAIITDVYRELMEMTRKEMIQ